MAARKKKDAVPQSAPSLAELLGMDPAPPQIEDDEGKTAKISPFDFLGAINYSKEQLIVDNVTEEQYLPFIVNRGLANSMDTVIYANEMNSRPHLEKAMQFAFLLSTVKKRKRYDKWAKAEEVENLALVKEYYGFSDDKGITALSILTEDQLNYIRSKCNKGGSKA